MTARSIQTIIHFIESNTGTNEMEIQTVHKGIKETISHLTLNSGHLGSSG